jgi:uncharacterized protein (TIGR03382 family)
MILLLASLAFAETDTIGGTDSYNDNSEMMKLVELDVRESAVITELSFAVYGRDTRSEVILVAYQQVGGRFELVGSAEGVIANAGEQQWASSGDVSWLLEAGEVYVIGAYVGDGWYYFYEDDRTEEPWFADVSGSYQAESDVVDVINVGDRENHYYYMEVSSEPADADGDGFAAQEFGGTDCDDNDPNVGEATVDIPYDGLDQDCVGGDLVDVDGDGVSASEVGGADCDDANAAIAPGLDDVCDDGVDQDCVGGDESCSGENPSIDGSNKVVDASPGCGCNAGGSGAALGAVLLAAVAARGRRKR